MKTEEILKILACPKCHGELTNVEKAGESGFECAQCQVVYPVRNDIPIMLTEEAIPVSDWRGKA